MEYVDSKRAEIIQSLEARIEALEKSIAAPIVAVQPEPIAAPIDAVQPEISE